MSSSASPAPSRRKTLLSLGVLALLTGIVVFIFREHWAEISEALSRLTLGQGLLALAVGCRQGEARPRASTRGAPCPQRARAPQAEVRGGQASNACCRAAS